MWDVLPYGPQTIYSNLVWEQPGIPILNLGGPSGLNGAGMGGAFPPATANFGYIEGNPQHGRYWNEALNPRTQLHRARQRILGHAHGEPPPTVRRASGLQPQRALRPG